MFENWATPVTSKPWALIAKVVWRVQALTGHRLNGRYAHRAWRRATRCTGRYAFGVRLLRPYDCRRNGRIGRASEASE